VWCYSTRKRVPRARGRDAHKGRCESRDATAPNSRWRRKHSGSGLTLPPTATSNWSREATSFRTSEEELPVLRSLVAEAHKAGLTSVELLDAEQTREIIPSATGPFLGAMWSPVDAHCQPEKGTEYYVRRAERAGAHIAYQVKVTHLLETASRISGVNTTAGRIQAGAVVVAAGVWTPYLAKSVGLNVPIMPVIMAELETEPVKPLFTQTIRAFGFGARQRPCGRVVVSAGLNAKVTHHVSLADFRGTFEQIRRRSTLDTSLVPQFSPEPAADRNLVNASMRRLSTVLPELEGIGVSRYWGGLVDMTPDGLPIIDGAAGPSGLTLITGLSGHGFTLGPVLGEIAADLSLDGTTHRPITPFRLSRYSTGEVERPEMMI
jgi:sarcosine oxidase, subunit beta